MLKYLAAAVFFTAATATVLLTAPTGVSWV